MTATEMLGIDTRPVDRNAAAAIEAAEARAWEDLYAAAPADWARAAGLGSRRVGGALILNWVESGRRYFSRAIGLAVGAPATRAQLDQVLAGWQELGIETFLVQSLPHCQPQAYELWLRERDLEPFDQQDRVVRGGEPLSHAAAGSGRELVVESVSRETADEWSEFIQRTYRLDTGPWLPRLIGRQGWHQYVVREAGNVVGARGMYVGADGIAWLGMDGPVPGIMTSDYEPDAVLCAQIVADGLRHSASAFIADIEAPSPAGDTPAYEYFARLGFRRPYVRTHHARPASPRS